MSKTESGIIKLRLAGTETNIAEILSLLNKDDFETYTRPQKGNNPKYADSSNVLCYLEIQTNKLKGILTKEAKKNYNHL